MQDLITKYSRDIRRRLIRGSDEYATLALYASDEILALNWHWLAYFAAHLPPLPSMKALLESCIDCDAVIPGIGRSFIDRIAEAGSRQKNEEDYQAILQIFAEILSLRQAFHCRWTGSPRFEYEAKGSNGKRPELAVHAEGQRFLFEVKAPSLLVHQRQRATNGLQIPARTDLKQMAKMLLQGPVTLPRDNPIKDFLISAEGKFAGFDDALGANILIIVWDDHIYEPITTLLNDETGLLTDRSYAKGKDGKSLTFPHIDAVILVRHLNYFQEGLAEKPLPDRQHMFDFGGEAALPNVLIQTPWGRSVPSEIIETYRAVPHNNPALLKMAEYNQINFVLWTDG